jgi:hypothetical protein
MFEKRLNAEKQRKAKIRRVEIERTPKRRT